VSIVAPDGSATTELPLTHADLVAGYEAVARARYFDQRAVTLQRQGRLGVYAPFRGQEAAQVGAALALSAKDWLAPTYRETGAAITHGLPIETALLYWRSHPEGWAYPSDLRLLPFYVPIASQLTHAVGLAHAGKLMGEDWVCMAFVGDGGSSEGDFHEALNFAAVFQDPVVFFVQNNGWAISVPTSRQMRNPRISDRSAGYGIPGVTVDGNDLVAVLDVARQAVARARAGDGPTLIEALTYRLAPHTTSDDPGRYRDVDDAAEHERLEPVGRLRTLLGTLGLWDEAREVGLQEGLAAEFAAALAAADGVSAAGLTDAGALVEHVFAEPGPDQRAALEYLRGR
jgi:pyruvate dehydrogenase E1 component alpha subunit